MKVARVAPHVLVLCLLAVVPARAGDRPYDRATLKGVTAVFVDVQPLDATATEAGVDAAALAKDLDLKLHLAGITPMRSADDDVPPGERGVLSVNVSLVPVRELKGAYAYAVLVSLLQGVVLVRDGKTVLAAPTWWVAKSGLGSAYEIREAVGDAADKFLTAYRSVNTPK